MQQRCMIPRRVTTRAEIYPGFGARELLAVAIGILLGYFCYLLTVAIAPATTTSLRFILPLFFAAAAWLLVMNGEQSILNAQIRAIRQNRLPKRLLFRLGLPALPALLSGKPRTSPNPSPIPTSVQQWLPVQDLHPAGFMVRRDGSLVAAIRVEPRNLGLLSETERLRLLRSVRSAINAVTTPENQLLSVSRPIDLDGYIRRLDALLPDLTPQRQRLLRQYIRHVSDLVAGGDAQERRYYILFARPSGKGAADELRQQAADLAARLQQADLSAYTVDYAEMLSLLYVFHHPAQAAFERPQTVPYITTIVQGGDHHATDA